MAFAIGGSSSLFSLGSSIVPWRGESKDVLVSDSSSEAKLATDIEEAVEEQKSQSLAYLLMQAIFRVNNTKNDGKHRDTYNRVQHSIEIGVSQSRFSLASQGKIESKIANSRADNVFETQRLSEVQASRDTLTINIESSEPEMSDPLILNLNDSDFGFLAKQSISFDLNADGKKDSMSNLMSGNAFLAIDKNGNGIIDDGSELFGDTRGAVDGFDDLSRYDINLDAQINVKDKIFESLLLFSFDRDGNQSMKSLSAEGVEQISLDYVSTNKSYAGENLLVSEAVFERSDGSLGRVGDFLLSIS